MLDYLGILLCQGSGESKVHDYLELASTTYDLAPPYLYLDVERLSEVNKIFC